MPQPIDIAIATTVNDQLKASATSCAKAACESSASELRKAFTQISQESIQLQSQLSRMMASKGWYVPPPADQATINQLMPQLQAAMGGLGGQFAPGAQPGTTNPTPPM